MRDDRHDELLEKLQEQIDRLAELVDAMGQTEQPASAEVVLTNRVTHQQLRIPWREVMLWRDCGNPDYSLVGRGPFVYAVCESMNEVRMRVKAARTGVPAASAQGVADPTPEQLREAAEGLAAEAEPKTVTLPPYTGTSDIEWMRIDRIGRHDGESALRVEGRYRTSSCGWTETCFGLFCSLDAAEITKRVRKVWPKFSCPGCTEPFVVLMDQTTHTPMKFSKIKRIHPNLGDSWIMGVFIGHDGSRIPGYGANVAGSPAEIIAAAVKTGVPCLAIGEQDAEERGPDDEDDRHCLDCSYYHQCDRAPWRCRLGQHAEAPMCPVACTVDFGRKLVTYLGGDASKICDNWCWQDFFAAYGDLAGAAVEYLCGQQEKSSNAVRLATDLRTGGFITKAQHNRILVAHTKN